MATTPWQRAGQGCCEGGSCGGRSTRQRRGRDDLNYLYEYNHYMEASTQMGWQAEAARAQAGGFHTGEECPRASC